ncbi:MAG: IclR family transcriptional regulator [Flavobacteriaceae bacterium]
MPAVVKCIAVTRLLDTRHTEGASLSDIAATLGITKSHCLAILRTLAAEGWVVHDTARRRYFLGSGLLRDFGNLLGRRDRTAQIHAELATLSAETELPSILCRLDDEGNFIVVDKVEATGELLASVLVGHRYPWDAPAQLRARLAFSDPATVEATLRRDIRAFTARTIVDRKRLRAEIEATGKRGYAVGYSEYTPGIMSVAAPILDAFGNVSHVLQCPGVQPVMEPREPEIAASLLRVCDRIKQII